MKICIFGSNGMLGRYFYLYLKQFYEVIPIDRKKLDALNSNINDIDRLFKKMGCDDKTIVINCIGIIPQRTSFNDTEKYIRVNSEFPLLLNSICEKYLSHFVHITTDCIYDGKQGQYNENDQATESNIYGLSKALGEPLTATVIRTSIIGEESLNKKSLLEWVRSQNGQTITGFNNHLWNGVTCLQLAKIIAYIIHNNLFWKGVRHIYSPHHLSKYELVKLIIEIYDLQISVIEFNHKEKSDKTLTSIYTTCQSLNIPSIKQQIMEMKNFQYINLFHT